MGITIHYSFMIRNRDAVVNALKEVKDIAVKLRMQILQRSETSLIIHPHPGCESIGLNFKQWGEVKQIKNWDYCKDDMSDFEKVLRDKDFVCSDFTKTQYAGYRIHMLVAEILRKVASKCTLAYVSDEAAYYESNDRDRTIENFDKSNEMISRIAGELKDTFGKKNVYCAIDHVEES